VGTSTYLDVYYIGIANTLLVAVLGIFAATVIGFTLGIMRLSNNVVFRAFATYLHRNAEEYTHSLAAVFLVFCGASSAAWEKRKIRNYT
jgi:ABC-type amino acid transport system permease subunit